MDIHLLALFAHEKVHYRQNIESKGKRLAKPCIQSLILDEVEAYLMQSLVLNGWITSKQVEGVDDFISATKKHFKIKTKKCFMSGVALSDSNFSSSQVGSIKGSINYLTKGNKLDQKISEEIYEIVEYSTLNIVKLFKSNMSLEDYLKKVRKLAKKRLKKALKQL
jgi:hypothetical protein